MEYITLGEICDIKKGSISITKAVEGEYPLVATKEARGSHNEFQFSVPSVIVPLVSATGHGHASISRVHYQEGKYIVGNILAACIPKNPASYSAKFLYLYFSLMKDYVLVPLMKGSANVSLTVNNLKKATVPNVSYSRQKEVIAIYDCVNPIVEKTLNHIGKQLDLISKLRRSILKEAVQGKLTADWRKANHGTEPASELLKRIKGKKEKLIAEKKIKKEKPLPPVSEEEMPYIIPESWKWCRFQDCAHIASNLVKVENHKDYPHIAPDVIEKGNGKLLNYRTVAEDGVISSKHLFKSGQIIYSKIRPKLNKLVEVDFKGLCSADMYPIDSFINRGYLFRYMLSPSFIAQSVKTDTRVAMPKINQTELNRIIVPIPPLNEQKAIVSKVNTLMDHCDQIEEKIAQSKAQAKQLMQAALYEAFTPREDKEDIIRKLIPDIDKYAQVAMATLKIENELKCNYGKVEKQKTGFLLQAIKKQPIPYTFEKQHFGTFSWELSNDLDTNPYIRKTKAGQGEVYEVKANKHQKVLDLLNAPKNASFVQALDELIQVYKMPLINAKTDQIELLNTVCKSILDTQSTELDTIYGYMEFWTIKQEGFNTKTEKFSRPETEKMLQLVLKLGWDKELINPN